MTSNINFENLTSQNASTKYFSFQQCSETKYKKYKNTVHIIHNVQIQKAFIGYFKYQLWKFDSQNASANYFRKYSSLLSLNHHRAPPGIFSAWRFCRNWIEPGRIQMSWTVDPCAAPDVMSPVVQLGWSLCTVTWIDLQHITNHWRHRSSQTLSLGCRSNCDVTCALTANLDDPCGQQQTWFVAHDKSDHNYVTEMQIIH